MNLKHEFNRIGHLIHDGAEQARRDAGGWADKSSRTANQIAKKARRGIKSGRRHSASFEESLVEHARGNPALYILGAALLAGLLIAKLVMEARHREQAPLL